MNLKDAEALLKQKDVLLERLLAEEKAQVPQEGWTCQAIKICEEALALTPEAARAIAQADKNLLDAAEQHRIEKRDLNPIDHQPQGKRPVFWNCIVCKALDARDRTLEAA